MPSDAHRFRQTANAASTVGRQAPQRHARANHAQCCNTPLLRFAPVVPCLWFMTCCMPRRAS
eukprot:457612-Alexandrium_andersonii.AAC.1